jgi:hypothetical protein
MPYLLILLFSKKYKSFIVIFLFHLLSWAFFRFFFEFHSISNPIISFFVLPTLFIIIKDLFFPIDDLRNSDNFIFNYILCVIWSCTYLSTILTQYINGFDYKTPIQENFDMLLLWLTSAIQGKLYLSSLQVKSSLFIRVKNFLFKEWLILIDLTFLILLLSKVLFGLIVDFEIIFFFYGFRLVRILLLVPYFDDVWHSIKRGLKLTGNYIASFIVILFIFSINSRILFSKMNPNFSDIPTSIYSNFKIILGNGFDIVDNIDKNLVLVLYIFSVTLIIGVIFTSTITALITDSLILKKENNKIESRDVFWYKKQVDETNLMFTLRLIMRISSI